MVKNKPLIFLMLGVLVLKLILLPFAQTIDADSVTRIFSAIHWKDNPVWIKTNVWGPFHYYLNGIALSIWENRVLMPKLLNIVISCLTLFPFYFFVKREFNERGAFYATLALAFCPILFKTSFLSLSNTPFLFLLMLSINELSKGRKRDRIYPFILAGIYMTLASGFRYESWLIMAIYGFLLLLEKRILKAIYFGIFACIFPIIWMISNYLETGDPLFSLNGNYAWTHDMMGINDNVHWKEYIRRIIFFPYSWVLLIGILSTYLIGKEALTTLTKERTKWFWLVPFVVLFLLMIYNSFKGNLLNHHRFTGTLVMLSLPFVASYFSNVTRKKQTFF